MNFAHTEILFSTSDSRWQRVFDTAERIERNNIVNWLGKRYLVEDGVYQGLWLETQPISADFRTIPTPRPS